MPHSPTTLPTVTLPLDPPVTVTFDLERLEAIEHATGESVTSICFDRLSAGASADRVLQQLSVTFMRKFVAGCLGRDPDRVMESVPVAALFPCVMASIAPFGQAVAALLGSSAIGGAEGNSPDSAPGPASNSA